MRGLARQDQAGALERREEVVAALLEKMLPILDVEVDAAGILSGTGVHSAVVGADEGAGVLVIQIPDGQLGDVGSAPTVGCVHQGDTGPCTKEKRWRKRGFI